MKTALEELVNEMISRGIYFEDAVREFEKRFILNVLDRHRGNVSRAAQELHIHRNTLSKKLELYNNGELPMARLNGKRPAKRQRKVARRR